MEQNNNKTWEVIINPVSGRKKSLKLWNNIKPGLEQAHIKYHEYITQYEGHAIELTKQIIDTGGKNILIVGGDGTANEVVNGIFSVTQNRSEIILGMISTGTGNDWVRTIGKYEKAAAIPHNLINPEIFYHDVGIIEYQKNNRPEKRYFINIAGLGFDGLTAKKVAEGSRFLQGTKLQYWIAIFSSLISYKHAAMQFTVDGEHTTINTLSVAAGICKYNGGGMMQLPNAKYNDGLLDMTVIGDMSKLKMVKSLPKLTDGSFIAMKEIKMFKGKEIIITCDKPIHVEADGEYLGEAPVRISILPSVLTILKWK